MIQRMHSWLRPRRRPEAKDTQPAPAPPVLRFAPRRHAHLPTPDDVEARAAELDRRLEIIDAKLAVLSEDLDD